MLFKVQSKFGMVFHKTYTVYAVRSNSFDTQFLIYNDGWEWRDASDFIPVNK